MALISIDESPDYSTHGFTPTEALAVPEEKSFGTHVGALLAKNPLLQDVDYAYNSLGWKNDPNYDPVKSGDMKGNEQYAHDLIDAKSKDEFNWKLQQAHKRDLIQADSGHGFLWGAADVLYNAAANPLSYVIPAAGAELGALGRTAVQKVGLGAIGGAAVGAGQDKLQSITEGRVATGKELGLSAALGGVVGGIFGPTLASKLSPIEQQVASQAIHDTGTVTRDGTLSYEMTAHPDGPTLPAQVHAVGDLPSVADGDSLFNAQNKIYRDGGNDNAAAPNSELRQSAASTVYEDTPTVSRMPSSIPSAAVPYIDNIPKAANPAELLALQHSTQMERAIPIPDSMRDALPFNGIENMGFARNELGLKAATPVRFGMMSDSPTMRQLSDMFGYNNVYKMGNKEGVASPLNLQGVRDGWFATAARAERAATNRFLEYATDKIEPNIMDRIGAKLDNTKMSRAEFNEQVAQAMRNGDTHENRFVQEAARIYRQGFDHCGNEMRSRGLLDSFIENGIDPDEALSYLTRKYNVQKIVARRPAFEQLLRTEFRKTNPDMVDSAIEDSVQRAVNHIIGNPTEDRSMFDTLVPKGTALKPRSLLIDDNTLAPWLVNDVSLLNRNYGKMASNELAWNRMFGSRQLDGVLEHLENDYKLMRQNAGDDENKLTSLGQQQSLDKKMIEALRDRFFGVKNTSDWLPTGAANTIMTYEFIRLMGGNIISQLADVAGIGMKHGLWRIAPILAHNLTELGATIKTYDLAKAELNDLAIATESMFHERLLSSAELLDPYEAKTTTARVMGNAAVGLQKAIGLDWHNDFWKGVTALLNQKAIYEKSKQLVDGTISKKDIQKLAQSGIDSSIAERLVNQFETHGITTGKFPVSNMKNWTDPEVKELYEAILRKEVNTQITTPNLTHKPLYMDSNTGKVINQFRSFSMANHMQKLVSAGQQNDLAGYSALAGMFAIGGLQVLLRSINNGTQLPDTPEEWGVKAFNESGIATLPMMMNTILEQGSNGTQGLTPWLTGKEPSALNKYRDVNWGSVVGPTGGAIGTGLNMLKDAANDELSYKDIHDFRSLLPLQNLMYINRPLNNVEDFMTDYMGVKANSHPREPSEYDPITALTK